MASEVVRDGCFAINKAKGVSSAQVVRECQDALGTSDIFSPLIKKQKTALHEQSHPGGPKQRLIKKAEQLKIGHGGTLDPLATGVLILGIGSATKSLNQFLSCVKVYETTVLFGASTDTYDRVGRVLVRRPYEHITKQAVQEKLNGMVGTQMQVPPLYSALKMNGKPLYEYARKGLPIPRDIVGREIEIKEIEMLEWYEPGTHKHYWPTEEADAAETNLAEQVWKLRKRDEESGKLTPEEKQEEDKAVAAHETFKKEFEDRQDKLVSDSPRNKKQRQGGGTHEMSGALPAEEEEKQGLTKSERRKENKRKFQEEQKQFKNKKPNLMVPETAAEAPWEGKGPAACKIRIMASSGFYVRSFCNDLGLMMDSAALMAELERVRQSDFMVGEPSCFTVKELQGPETKWGPKMANALARWNGEPTDDEGFIPSDGTPKETSQSPRRDSQRQRSSSPRRPEQYQVSPQKRRDPPSRSPSPAAKIRRASQSSEKSWAGIAD